MKNKIIITLIVIISILGFSCNKSEESKMSIVEGVYDNLHAPEGGDFVKLKFIADISTPEALITNSENNWDIAFRGTMIIVNGGVKTGSGNEPERVSVPQISAYINILNRNYGAVFTSYDLENRKNRLQHHCICTSPHSPFKILEAQKIHLALKFLLEQYWQLQSN